MAAMLGMGETRVRVTAEHTNLRYQNADNVEIACVVAIGQELLVHGDIEGYWLPITPPDDIHVWIYSELVRKGRVVRDRAQLRCGPGLAFKVVGSVNQGTIVETRGRSGDWVKLKPPKGLVVWVSRTAVTVLPTNAPPEIAPLPADLATGLLSALLEPTNGPAAATSATNLLASTSPPPAVILATNRAARAALPAELATLPLTASPLQGRRMRFHGTLRPAIRGATAAPATQRLTYADSAGGIVTACQILLAGEVPGGLPVGTIVTLEGPAWWLKDESCPVVVLESLTVEK
jgi:hypothetical protein